MSKKKRRKRERAHEPSLSWVERLWRFLKFVGVCLVLLFLALWYWHWYDATELAIYCEPLRDKLGRETGMTCLDRRGAKEWPRFVIDKKFGFGAENLHSYRAYFPTGGYSQFEWIMPGHIHDPTVGTDEVHLVKPLSSQHAEILRKYHDMLDAYQSQAPWKFWQRGAFPPKPNMLP